MRLLAVVAIVHTLPSQGAFKCAAWSAVHTRWLTFCHLKSCRGILSSATHQSRQRQMFFPIPTVLSTAPPHRMLQICSEDKPDASGQNASTAGGRLLPALWWGRKPLQRNWPEGTGWQSDLAEPSDPEFSSFIWQEPFATCSGEIKDSAEDEPIVCRLSYGT